MSTWTPDRIREILDARRSAGLRQLGELLTDAVTAGRGVLLARKPWLRLRSGDKEDDVQDGLVALFAKDAAILRKFGEHESFQPSEDALRRYVIGVTIFVLQRKYQRRKILWEELREDLARAEVDERRGELATLVRVLDLEEAVKSLSVRDQQLFRMLYVEQLDAPEVARRLGIKENACYVRKTRLLQRLRAHCAAPSGELAQRRRA
jgi:RNA polymerase sigma factor (sigma-70 family)